MKRAAPLFRRLILDQWPFKAACVSLVLASASAVVGWFALSLVSKSVELQPRDVAALSEQSVVGPVFWIQIVSLILGIASFIGGIIKKDFAIILLAVIGILASGFFGLCAIFFLIFNRMGC